MFHQRTIIIGDVHGCSNELKNLIEKVHVDLKSDRLIFVGDLINKGPDSKGVLDFAIKSNAECVLGNHEVEFLSHLEGKKTDPRMEKVKHQLGSNLDKYVKWIKAQPLYIEAPEFLVVHAGLQPGKKPKDTPTKILTSVRTWDGKGDNLKQTSNPPWYELYKEDKLVIYGHWALDGLKVRKNTIGLDSGCVYGGQLSALVLPAREVIQVPSQFSCLDS